jgi:hypothetical protein
MIESGEHFPGDLMIHRFGSYLPCRFPLPISSGVNILPGQSVSITARPQTSKFYPERLLIKDAFDWRIDNIYIGGYGAICRDLSGSMFAPDVLGRFPGCGEIEIFSGGDLSISARYIGHKESGIPFEACVFGSDDRMPTIARRPRQGQKKIATARSECAISAQQTAQLFTDPMKHDAWPCRLLIKNASDWTIHDVCVGEVSIFAQSGYVPGSMFSEEAESEICLGRLTAGDKFSVVATYVGSEPGAEFSYEVYGTHDESEVGSLPVAVILPMSSGCLLRREISAQITGRCQPPAARRRGIGPHQGFLAEQIFAEDASDWIINDIKIGRVSQFAQCADIPGLAFSPGTLGCQVSFDLARTLIDVAIITSYSGPRESGDIFTCGILGSVVDLPAIDQEPQRGRVLSVHDLR